MSKCRFRVGQVVNLGQKIEYYQKPKHKDKAYQKITRIEPWGVDGFPGHCLTFANGDRCHDKWVVALNKTERGRE